jgi:alcohol dehydrogenase (cytochrome c)/quinohemoprotein ethanol dehydrogenase
MLVGQVKKATCGAFALGLAVLFAACSTGESQDTEWPVHAGTAMAESYSPLDQIDRDNVSELGLAWSLDLETEAGQEATPIMVGGLLYTVSAYDIVMAVEARTGELLWRHDPDVREASARSCCGPVSRGVAVSEGRVFLGALDGRLIALDAESGDILWETQTIDADNPHAINYTITGAPIVVGDKVIIGNGGAEFGVRGYVGAYDTATGELAWRFYTVPGDPADGPDNAASDEAMAMAAESWSGEWWRWGGGGTVWDSIAYDPELDLLYIGTGNGSAWNYGRRSNGEGDNLFLSSIVALRPETGEYVWHFQEVPGESWDYTATQNMILADLEIGNEVRHVLMQAPKNGFLYVIDRETGEFISAEAYVEQNWALGIDPDTGRPEINPDARYYETGRPFFQRPSSGGGHNWPPMAFSPDTGLVYIPAQDTGMPYAPEDEEPQLGAYSSGVAIRGGGRMNEGQIEALYADMHGYLVAWDPVTQREVWRHDLAAPFNGGVLATGGGLVFQGNVEGRLVAYDARDGSELWSFDAQTGIVARPITYRLDGIQYVAVMAGYGGGWPLTGGLMALQAGNAIGPNRLLVFRLDGEAQLPEPPERTVSPLDPPDIAVLVADVARGDFLYGRYCMRCHGAGAVSAGAYPDLRRTPLLGEEAFEGVVLGGALAPRGMPGFARQLTRHDLAAIRAYLVSRAREDREAEDRQALEREG